MKVFLFGKEFVPYQDDNFDSIWKYKNIEIFLTSSLRSFFIRSSSDRHTIFNCHFDRDIQNDIDSNITKIILRIYDLYSFKESFRIYHNQISPIHLEIKNLFPKEIFTKILNDFKELISEEQLNKLLILI